MSAGIFQPVALTWGGREYVIPPDQVLKAIAIVESILTLGQLHNAMMAGAVPFAKLSQAFAAVLRYAGAQVSAEEVYAAMFQGGDEMRTRAMHAIQALQMLMIPPVHLQQRAAAQEGSTEGKV